MKVSATRGALACCSPLRCSHYRPLRRRMMWTSLSRLQLALQLIEQAKIGAVGDDALRVVLDHTELMHAQCIKPDRVLGIVVAPKIVGDFGDGLQRVVVARGKAAIDEQPRGLFGRTGAEVGGF